MAGGVCVESCSDGPRAICRILQAIVAGLLLFTGITCQFWAGLNINDIPLSKLCNTYSGSPEVMTTNDFNALADWFEKDVVKCKGERRDCFSFYGASRYFMQSSGLDPSRADLMHYADAQFFCKRAPNGADPKETCVSLAFQANRTGDLYPCKLWPGQEKSPTDSGNWYLATVRGTRGPVFHVNCYDKTQVYTSFLESIYGGKWKREVIKAAADQFRQACVVDKGSDGYMLIIGPLIAFMGGVITTCTMFKAFASPPWPDLVAFPPAQRSFLCAARPDDCPVQVGSIRKEEKRKSGSLGGWGLGARTS